MIMRRVSHHIIIISIIIILLSLILYTSLVIILQTSVFDSTQKASFAHPTTIILILLCTHKQLHAIVRTINIHVHQPYYIDEKLES